ncbi:MAG: ABC transporter permease, partial [Acidimicrobiaceae bacterium]|nr:ABC transporter permease [Acidimicrobiaceae bacterium]
MVRPVGILTDIATVARRSVRSLLREPEAMAPALIIPTFFFLVNIGALESFVERSPGIDYRAFQIPVAIIFAVTGISRASVLVIDIQTGYLDRMLVTPVRRTTLLLGMMVADIVLAISLSLVVIAMGFVAGVRFETGLLGILVFLGLAVAWSLSFTGFPYTVALRTGNPAAVNSSFLIFFPFAFLTP